MIEWDDSDDDGSGDEWPDESAEDSESVVVPCPLCGAEIYEDAVRCPVCGEYVTRTAHSVWDAKPLWWVALGAVGIVAVIAALAAI
ncbi:MAG: hypothetical protein AB7U20_11790 [Planctomycetaceae bacterium]